MRGQATISLNVLFGGRVKRHRPGPVAFSGQWGSQERPEIRQSFHSVDRRTVVAEVMRESRAPPPRASTLNGVLPSTTNSTIPSVVCRT